MTEPGNEPLAYQTPEGPRAEVEVNPETLRWCMIAWVVMSMVAGAGGAVLSVFTFVELTGNNGGAMTVLAVTFTVLGAMAGLILSILGRRRLGIVVAMKALGFLGMGFGALVMVGSIVLGVVAGGLAVFAPFYFFWYCAAWVACGGMAVGGAAAGKQVYLVGRELEAKWKRERGVWVP